MSGILVPLDGSVAAERALPYAAELAQALGSALQLVQAIPHGPGGQRGYQVGVLGAEAYPRSQAERLIHLGLEVCAAVRMGDPYRVVQAAIERGRPDLIVMAAQEGRSPFRLLAPTLSDCIVAGALAPVVLVPPSPPDVPPVSPLIAGRDLLVPLDGSRFAEAALPVAGWLARALGSVLVLVQAVEAPLPPPELPFPVEFDWSTTWDEQRAVADAEAYLCRMTRRVSMLAPHLPVRILARVGWLPEEVAALSAADRSVGGPGIGLTVMATHGRAGLSKLLLGSTADAVFHAQQRPLLLIRPRLSNPMVTATQAIREEASRGSGTSACTPRTVRLAWGRNGADPDVHLHRLPTTASKPTPR